MGRIYTRSALKRLEQSISKKLEAVARLLVPTPVSPFEDGMQTADQQSYW